MKSKGILISAEGIGGCGKSSFTKNLGRWLESEGHPVIYTREPGGTPLGQQLRQLLLAPGAVIDPLAEALLFQADRAQNYAHQIAPALFAGNIVISDRNVYGTTAYQGFGRNLDLALIHQLNQATTKGHWPDVAFVLDLGPKLAMSRKAGQQEVDRFDDEALAFQARVREGYLYAAQQDVGVSQILDASLLPEQVLAQAIETLKSRNLLVSL